MVVLGNSMQNLSTSTGHGKENHDQRTDDKQLLCTSHTHRHRVAWVGVGSRLTTDVQNCSPRAGSLSAQLARLSRPLGPQESHRPTRAAPHAPSRPYRSAGAPQDVVAF